METQTEISLGLGAKYIYDSNHNEATPHIQGVNKPINNNTIDTSMKECLITIIYICIQDTSSLHYLEHLMMDP